MAHLGGDVGERLQHEGVAQFAARDLQVAGAIQHEVVVEHDVDIEGAARPARHVATAAVAVFQRMQPGVECVHVEVAVEGDREVDEIRRLHADGRHAVRRRHRQCAEARTQFVERGAQVDLRVDVGAEAEVDAGHERHSRTRHAGGQAIRRRQTRSCQRYHPPLRRPPRGGIRQPCGATTMHPDIRAFNDALEPAQRSICDALADGIDRVLGEAESRIWHGSPVWFLDGNPVVGYSRQKPGIRLMFWSGADFDEPGLDVRGGKFRDASVFCNDVAAIDADAWRAGSARRARSSGTTRTSSSARACWNG